MSKRLSAVLLLSLTLSLSACFTQPKPAEHPKFGKEAWIGLTAVAGTQDPAVNGAAIGHLFADGTFIQTIQLNIEKAPKGKMYAAWLLKGDTDRLYLGELQSPTGDVRHSLTFTIKQDMRDYRTLIVTLQDNGKTGTPGVTVAKGTVEDVKK